VDGTQIQQATLGLSQNGLGMGSMLLSLEASSGVKLGPDGLPLEMLLWRDGATRTTKGTFKLTDRARGLVWDDWQARMSGVSSPSGQAPGSFDYDHDEFNENLPGYQKISAGSFDLGKDGKDFWLTKCGFTDLAGGQIKRKEKRSTSGAFYFDPKTGEFTSLINCALTNLPATYKQPLLSSGSNRSGVGLVLTPPDGSEDDRRVLVQVPAIFLSSVPDKTVEALRIAVDLLGQGKIGEAGQALLSFVVPPPVAGPSSPTPPPPPKNEGATPAPTPKIGAVPYAKYPLSTKEWNHGMAVERLLMFFSTTGSGAWDDVDPEKFRQAAAYVTGEGRYLTDYLFIHHDVEDGKLVTSIGGVEQACAELGLASSGVPVADQPPVKQHLAEHLHEVGKKAPWEVESATTATTSTPSVKRLSMYEMNAHEAVARHLAHLGYGIPVMHGIMKHAKHGGHMSDHGHYEDHLKRLSAYAEHLVKHAKRLGEELPGMTAAQLSMTDLPEHIKDAPLHHLLQHKMMHTADGMMMSAHLARCAKAAGHEDMMGPHEEHMRHMAEHMKHLSDHAIKSPMEGHAMASILAADPEMLVKRAMFSMGVTSRVELIPAIADQHAMLEQAKRQALTALSAAGKDVKTARATKIKELLDYKVNGQATPLITPAQAQEADGLDPATGKPSGLLAWSLEELAAVERRALARLSGQAQGTSSVAPGGIPVVTPPPAPGSAPLPGEINHNDPALLQHVGPVSQNDAFEMFKAMCGKDLAGNEYPEITLKAMFAASLSGKHGQDMPAFPARA
jgi:Mu-like prophage I protein